MRIDYGELGKYYDEVTSQRGLKLLMYTEYGYRNFAMAKKQIKSVADMDGTKIRHHPLEGQRLALCVPLTRRPCLLLGARPSRH